MAIAAMRLAADTVLQRVMGQLTYDIGMFKRFRRRRGNAGGCYYGSTFFNSCEVGGNAPAYQLTKSAARGFIRFGSDLFSVWIIGRGDLQRMTRQPVSYILDWSHYAYIPLDEEGHLLVFPANRHDFATALYGATGHRVSPCV